MRESAAGVIAVDVGGTRLRAAVFDRAGAIRSHIVSGTPQSDPRGLLHLMRDAAEAADIPVSEAVVGVPGVVDYEAGTALFLPHLRGWEGTVSAASLAEALGMPVEIANDADLAALGEHRYGAGVGAANMVYLTCSTGVGAGVIMGGRLLHSRYSIAEVGHTVIDWRTGDTVEMLGSGSTLAASVEAAQEIERRAAAGEPDAMRSFGAVADAFATGVLTMIYCFMPDRVVIGGGVSAAGELLLGPVRERIRRAPNCPFQPADVVLRGCGDDAGLVGGYAYWLERKTDARLP